MDFRQRSNTVFVSDKHNKKRQKVRGPTEKLFHEKHYVVLTIVSATDPAETGAVSNHIPRLLAAWPSGSLLRRHSRRTDFSLYTDILPLDNGASHRLSKLFGIRSL